MQKISDQVFYSATDLTHFADCRYLTWLDRLNLDHRMEKAEDDEQAKLIQAKGIEHEEAFLDKLTARSSRSVPEPALKIEWRAREQRLPMVPR